MINLTAINFKLKVPNFGSNKDFNAVEDPYINGCQAKKELLKKLFEEKALHSNKNRFVSDEVLFIYYACRPDNKAILGILLNERTLDNKKYRFGGYGLSKMLEAFTPEKQEGLFMLLKARNEDKSKYRFWGFEIGGVLEHYSNDKKDVLDKLLKPKTSDENKFRFDAYEIGQILKSYTPKKRILLNVLLKAKNDEKEFSFTNNDVVNIMEHAFVKDDPLTVHARNGRVYSFDKDGKLISAKKQERSS